MTRTDFFHEIARRTEPWDMVVIGGGATGASVALDAASRGFQVVLLEQHDFGKGTSSRSTKLVHGGVRYLAQGNIALVRDALRERNRLARNAPHVVHEVSFLVPCAGWWEYVWYRLGFWVYDRLAGQSDFRGSRSLTQMECLQEVTTLRSERARYGVVYSDGQFDDCRLLIDILRKASQLGARVMNYAKVTELTKNHSGKIDGVEFVDCETGTPYSLRARCIVNATGPFCDALRNMDSPGISPMLSASQGVHLVLPRKFLPGDTAVIVPKTSDGRVIFMIPWLEHVVIGTTDTPISTLPLEPSATEDEIEFLLATSSEYLQCAPKRSDVLSVFTGIRPLVRKANVSAKTSSLARDHTIEVSPSGVVTITGGKWTTARKMGQDAVDRCIREGFLANRTCQTEALPLMAANSEEMGEMGQIPNDLKSPWIPGHSLRGADVIWAVRHAFARTVEDVLARRNRLLFLDVAAAERAAPRVAELMARELGRDHAWIARQLEDFHKTASLFRIDHVAQYNNPTRDD